MRHDGSCGCAAPPVRRRILGMLVAGLAAVAAGCGEMARAVPMPPAAPADAVAAPPRVSPPNLADGLIDAQDIPVERLIAIARQRTPTRAILEANRAAAVAAVAQAGAVANPEMEIEGGQGRPRDGGNAESTGRITLRQRLEFPGKRSSRIAAADAERQVVEDDGALLSLDVEAEVRTASVELAGAELSLEQAKRAADIAHQTADVVGRHAAAGEADRSDVLRVDLDQHQAAIDLDQRERAVEAARAALRILCAGALPEHFTVSDGLAVGDPPSLEQALAAAARHPRMARVQAVRVQRLAELQRENVAGRPDATVGAFAGRGIDGTEIGLSVGIELPLWNRNQGGIASAQADLGRADAEAEAAMREVRGAIEAAWHACTAAARRRDRLATEIQPLAAELLSRRLAAFAAGEVALGEALDARRVAQATDIALGDSRADAARAVIRLHVAMGTFASPPPRSTPEPKP